MRMEVYHSDEEPDILNPYIDDMGDIIDVGIDDLVIGDIQIAASASASYSYTYEYSGDGAAEPAAAPAPPPPARVPNVRKKKRPPAAKPPPAVARGRMASRAPMAPRAPMARPPTIGQTAINPNLPDNRLRERRRVRRPRPRPHRPRRPRPPPPQAVVHENTTCRQCGVSPIQGVRYRCANCPAYDVCSACEAGAELRNPHNPNHLFLKLKRTAPQPCHLYMTETLYTDAVEFGQDWIDGEVLRIVADANHSETLATLAATVATARRPDEVIVYPLAAHTTMALREFGWDVLVEGQGTSKLDLPLWSVFSAFARTLGYDMEIGTGANPLAAVNLRPVGGDGATATATATDGTAATATPGGDDGAAPVAPPPAAAANDGPMTDAQFDAAAATILGRPTNYPVLVDIKAMLDGAIDARKKRFVYTMDGNEAAEQLGMGPQDHRRVVDVIRMHMQTFGWTADVKKSSPPSYTLSIKVQK